MSELVDDPQLHAIRNCTGQWKHWGKPGTKGAMPNLLLCTRCGQFAYAKGNKVVELQPLTQRQEALRKGMPYAEWWGIALLMMYHNSEGDILESEWERARFSS